MLRKTSLMATLLAFAPVGLAAGAPRRVREWWQRITVTPTVDTGNCAHATQRRATRSQRRRSFQQLKAFLGSARQARRERVETRHGR